MSKLQEKLKEFIYCLNLPGNKDKIVSESLDFLKALNTDEISTNSNLVAVLFCTIMCNCSEEMINNLLVSELIWESYNNIKDLKCGKETKVSVEIIIIKFLKRLNNMSGMTGGDISPIDDQMQEQFKILCSKLEEMKIIFRLKNKGIEVFPIGKLLAAVIGKDFIFEKLDEITLNTFLLALEIFDSEPYIAERNKLDGIIDDCNLKCLKYLSRSSTLRIGGNAWKDNFKHNGVLILADIVNRMIYIRHPEKIYFSSLEGDERKKLDCERNSDLREIAYFYEYGYDPDATFISINDIMSNGNYNLKVAAIREVYNNKCYNSFFDKAFLKLKENIKAVNPCTSEDRTLIFENGEIKDANINNVTEYAMKPFSLVKIMGKGLDYVMFGSVCKLLMICDVCIEIIMNELQHKSNNYQDNLICIWLKYSNNIYENMLMLQKLYFDDVFYIKKRRTIDEKRIRDISWLPIKLPTCFLEDKLLELCDVTISGNIEKVLLERKENFNGNIVYKIVKDDIEIAPETLTIVKEERLQQERFFAVKYQERYFASSEIDGYIKLIRKIEDGNKELKKIEDFASNTESQIQLVLEAMKLQEKALNDIENCIVDFDSIARLRIFHHIIYNNIFTNDKWGNFISVINGHQQLKYEFIKELELLTENILIVPKEKQESDSALTSIINTYYRKSSTRTRDLYFSEIAEDNDGYTYRGQKIEKIIFLFDTIQSGTSTIRNLRFYFEDYDKRVIENVLNNHIVYYCNGREIRLEKIIERNHPIVEVIALYGSQEGKLNVETYMSSNKYISNKNLICLKEIEKVADKDFIDKVQQVYGKRSITIEENSFPIIREFNQPKKNAFPKDNLIGENIASIFVKKKELSRSVGNA